MVTREGEADRRYGLGRSLLPVVDELTRRGWTVRYLAQSDLPAERHDQRQRWVRRISGWPGLGRHANRQLLLNAWAERLDMGVLAAQVAQKDGYELVHLHDPWIGTGFRAGVRWLGLGAVRWGVTEHGFGSYCRATHEDGLVQGVHAQRLFRRIEASTLAAAHWVMAPTELSLEQLARDLAAPAPAAHWHVVPHARPDPDHQPMTEARHLLGWSSEKTYVLGVGRLVPLKRFDLLLTACIELFHRFPRLNLVLLGEGDRQALVQLAESAGFGDRLHFFVTDHPAPYFRASDLYVSMSASESFGLANLEALAAGLPAVCTAVGGVPEVVGNGAWLIPGNSRVLVQVLGQLLENAELRATWSERALNEAARAPDLATVTDSYESIYQGIPITTKNVVNGPVFATSGSGSERP